MLQKPDRTSPADYACVAQMSFFVASRTPCTAGLLDLRNASPGSTMDVRGKGIRSCDVSLASSVPRAASVHAPHLGQGQRNNRF
jgi:hypothetical protein